jgi:hypothetical protein
MFEKGAGARKKGASGTAELAAHRLWAKRDVRRRKTTASHSGSKIDARAASRIEVRCQRNRIGTSMLRLEGDARGRAIPDDRIESAVRVTGTQPNHFEQQNDAKGAAAHQFDACLDS